MVDVGLDSAPLGAGPVEVVLGQRLREVTVGVGSGQQQRAGLALPGAGQPIESPRSPGLRPQRGGAYLPQAVANLFCPFRGSLPRRAHGSPLAGSAGPVRTT